MAAERGQFNFEEKLEALKLEILHSFEELFRCLSEQKQSLLSQLVRMKEGHDKNIELDNAMKQLRLARDNALNVMTRNLLGDDLNSMREAFDDKIRGREVLKVEVEDLEFVTFRCYSEKILKSIEEITLIELIPEYIGRESPVLKKCLVGSGNGELYNPRGISIDKIKNEVYIADMSNSRIQVLSIEGEFIRSFGTEHLIEPFGICISNDYVFVTDAAKQSLIKFTLSGQFLKQTGSRGVEEGQFSGIRGLCCVSGLVYVCDVYIQRIQVFDTNLKFIKKFSFGELKSPADILFYSDTFYILSQISNTIYCYNRDCKFVNRIELTGQEQQMPSALFFALDSKGNFLISNHSDGEIRIFSPNGVMKQILGRGYLQFLSGIALDNSNIIICVSYGEGSDCYQKY